MNQKNMDQAQEEDTGSEVHDLHLFHPTSLHIIGPVKSVASYVFLLEICSIESLVALVMTEKIKTELHKVLVDGQRA